MTTVFEFTEAKLKTLPKPEGRDTYYKDTQVKGLWVRVSHRSGRKTFYFDCRTHHPQQGRKSVHSKRALGDVGELSLRDARRMATELRSARQSNNSFSLYATVTISDVCDAYRRLHSCSDGTKHILDRRITSKFGTRNALSIKTIEISQWHRAITKSVKVRDADGEIIRVEQLPAPHSADKALDVFKAVWNWAEKQQLLPRQSNPCQFAERNFSQSETERHYDWEDREITLLAETLARYEQLAREGHALGVTGAIVRGADGRIVTHYPSLWTIYAFRFLVLTGVRKSEALRLRWDQVEDPRGIIVWTRYKSRRQKRDPRPMIRIVTKPLAELLDALRAIRVPDNPHVFVGRAPGSYLKEIDKVWERLRASCNFRKPDGQRARIHDLRHWYGDEAADAGLNEKQIMALMGHSTTRMSQRYSKGRLRARATNAELVATILANKLAAS